MEKIGVPPKMLHITKSFLEVMRVEVRAGNSTTDSIEVRNGLRKDTPLF